jgi:hypothetical protein
MSNKKLAVILGGWHFPMQYFEGLSKQEIPEGWEVDYFVVSHRDPHFSLDEKKDHVYADDTRGNLDKLLYKEIATKEKLEKLGWVYEDAPNTIGDWEFTNQWLEKHNYKDYDLFLLSHDDNLILNDNLFKDVITDEHFDSWDILSNSTGMPPGWLRGSCEFFKPRVLDIIGGKFDTSTITLNRVGKTDNPEDKNDIYDWNNIVFPLMETIEKNGLRLAFLSPTYRISAYVLEGERGFISRTHGQNTAVEEEGLAHLKANGII